MTRPHAARQICAAIALILPLGDEEAVRNKVCGNCQALPEPPEEA